MKGIRGADWETGMTVMSESLRMAFSSGSGTQYSQGSTRGSALETASVHSINRGRA